MKENLAICTHQQWHSEHGGGGDCMVWSVGRGGPHSKIFNFLKPNLSSSRSMQTFCWVTKAIILRFTHGHQWQKAENTHKSVMWILDLECYIEIEL